MEASRVRIRGGLLAGVCAALVAGVLYPFEIAPPNGVERLATDDGLLFEGAGIAYSRTVLAEGGPLSELTVELWMVELSDPQNWGAREILSLFDGAHAPPFALGARGRRVFFFSRFEQPGPGDWYEQLLLDQRLEPETAHFLAASYGSEEIALYLDGAPVARRPSVATGPLRFSGRVVLGNAPDGRRGWWGAAKGVAIFGRALAGDEIARHGAAVAAGGVSALRGEPDLVALLPLGAERGAAPADGLAAAGGIEIPARFAPLPRSMLRLPFDDVPGRRPSARDAVGNVLLFLPVGFLAHRLRGGRAGLGIGLGVVVLGGLASLGLELTQLFIPDRQASSVDVLCNTLGTAAGVAIAHGLASAGSRGILR